jgi:hypothetical protein
VWSLSETRDKWKHELTKATLTISGNGICYYGGDKHILPCTHVLIMSEAIYINAST